MAFIKCPNCGNELPEGSLFCNKCGAKISELNINFTDNDNISSNTTTEQNSIKKNALIQNTISRIKMINTKWKIILGVFLSLIIIAGIGYKIIEPPSPEGVFKKIKNYNADNQVVYLNKVYPTDGGFLGMFKVKNHNNKGTVLSLLVKSINDEFKSETGMSIADYTAVKITKVQIEHLSYTNDYVNINITVNNDGKTAINYIKINLYYYDDEDCKGNIVKSEWTNDDSVIQPGANQTLTEMTKKDGWQSIHTEIAELR